MGRKPAAVQPNPTVFALSKPDEPQALERTQHVKNQVWTKENTLIYGANDDLPLRILDAINKSPVTTSCLGKVETFIKGSKFTEKDLMTLPIDEEGTTLWTLHCQICKYMATLEGFSVRFTFNGAGEITNSYNMNFESLRFVAPDRETSSKICNIKYNPYFGTQEYKDEFTKEYHLWDRRELPDQIAEGHKFKGQVYYYGELRPPYKFYPRPKYWAAEKWIYVDNAIQTFHKSNTDNGFFLSSLMTMIGDPNALSKNPKYLSEVTGTDGVKRMENVKKVTVGQEMNEALGDMFSGASKAGRTFVQWAQNIDDAAKIQSFPANTTFDVFAGTLIDTIRGITIATEVPAILANLPQQASSLGSDGNSMQKAVELMQASVASKQTILEEFYNNILLPNLANKTEKRVTIVNYSPINVPAEVPDKIWEWLNDKEKEDFVRSNYPNINVVPRVAVMPAAPAPVVPGQPPEESAMEVNKVNEAIKNLKISDINRIMSIVNKFEKSVLTYEQAKQILSGYGLDDEQIKAWLTDEQEAA